ncbi:MAG: XRE family transcriptional regulator [Lachnospiraceae bacterium]|nr:XRE family transcriptional regulator [Lachnospiraceae bacterium]
MPTIGSLITTYRKKKGLSQIALAGELNSHYGHMVSNKSISKWEKNLAVPDLHIFLDLCRLLEVPDLYEALYGNNPFNPFSALNDIGREKALEYVQLLCLDPRYRQDSAAAASSPACSRPGSEKIIPFRTIPLQLYPVSAGPGNFLDDENYEDIQVGEEVPLSADFAVRVSGDSMEPLLHKNQIIYVHRQETLENGEYGIFFLNGEAYVKRFQTDETGTFLISLNKKYDPLPVTEGSDFRIFGRLVFERGTADCQ